MMINIPKTIFVIGFVGAIMGAVLMGERLADPNIKCLKSFKRRLKHYVLPISIIVIGLLIIALDIAALFFM